MENFASAIYAGNLRHRRFSPKPHSFNYSVFMLYLDTSEIEKIFSLNRFWSMKHFSPVQFKRSDFHVHLSTATSHTDRNLSTENLSVDESVRRTIQSQTGERPSGPIRMLVNLRYWGFNMNPLSTYYCFDSTGEFLEYILAEVHNTPWNERHAYVLKVNEKKTTHFECRFDKEFHVSPFNPINMEYRWRSNFPENDLVIHLENWQHLHSTAEKVMDATLVLKREALTPKAMNKLIWYFPVMTVKVVVAIYWEALKLWIKRVPTHTHESPKKIAEDLPQHEQTKHTKISSRYHPELIAERRKLITELND